MNWIEAMTAIINNIRLVDGLNEGKADAKGKEIENEGTETNVAG